MHTPTTSVNFAPTAAFARNFPKDIAAEAKAFVAPTWAMNVEPDDPLPPKEKEELFIPRQEQDHLTQNEITQQQRAADAKRGKSVSVMVEPTAQDLLLCLAAGIFIGVGCGYLFQYWRGVVAE